MKRLKVPSLILACWFVSVPLIAAPPMSLREALVTIPQEFLPVPTEHRTKNVKIDDKKNGYLEAAGADAVGDIQMAMFKKKDGTYLYALSYGVGDSTDDFFVLGREGEHWKDVTKDVMPALTNEMVDKRAQEKIPDFKKNNKKLTDSASGTYAYLLPRKGTTIKVIVSSDAYTGPQVILWRLKFDGNKFLLSK